MSKPIPPPANCGFPGEAYNAVRSFWIRHGLCSNGTDAVAASGRCEHCFPGRNPLRGTREFPQAIACVGGAFGGDQLLERESLRRDRRDLRDRGVSAVLSGLDVRISPALREPGAAPHGQRDSGAARAAAALAGAPGALSALVLAVHQRLLPGICFRLPAAD